MSHDVAASRSCEVWLEVRPCMSVHAVLEPRPMGLKASLGWPRSLECLLGSWEVVMWYRSWE